MMVAAMSDSASGARPDDVVAELRRVASGPGERAARAVRAAELIRACRGYRWTGLYDVLAEEIAAIAWSGPEAPEYPRFPRTDGLSGAAVATGEPVVAHDVTTDPRYLTALGTTRSEAIVPVRVPGSGEVVGTVDVESERVGAFTDADVVFLEACAAALLPLWRPATSGAAEARG